METIYRSKYDDVEIPTIPLFEFVGKRIKAFGNKVALIDGVTGKEYTFEQVHNYVQSVASALCAKGFKKGDVLAILAPNSPEFVIALHGAIRAGGIVTTINPLYTVEEIMFQLKDANAKYLVTVSGILDKAVEAVQKSGLPITEVFTFDQATGPTPSIPVLPFSSLMDHPTVDVPDFEVDPKNDPILLPYSSGTTGLPKGVVLTHSNIISNLVQIPLFDVGTKDDIFIGFLPFFHIYAMTVIVNFSLVTGGTTITMPRFELDKFLALIQKYKATYLHVVPPVALALAKHPLVDKFDVSSVRMIFSGASSLGGELQRNVESRLKCKVKQAYGMTELSPGTHVTPTEDIVAGSIGLLIPNTMAKIVDLQTGESLPHNKEGELCIKGPQVMKEYLNRPDATATTIGSDGFLKTGDVAYVSESGHFFIVDRVKELIKYKGYQVPPAELEALLVSHSSVADAAVIPVPDEEAGELPKAFVVLKADHKLTPDEVHHFVDQHVAPYKKLRGGIEFIDVIPKSPAGKILRRILVQKEREKILAAKVSQ